MNYLRELLAVDSVQALQFFFNMLKEEDLPDGTETLDLIYVASVLAHYARTSVSDQDHTPLATDLSEVFDTFLIPMVVGDKLFLDPEVLEIAGTQTLVLNGFFRSQMRNRHNLGVFDKMGKLFFSSAGELTTDSQKREILPRVATHFTEWAMASSQINRKSLENRYLIDS